MFMLRPLRFMASLVVLTRNMQQIKSLNNTGVYLTNSKEILKLRWFIKLIGIKIKWITIMKNKKFRIGIVGLTPGQSWAHFAHLPALEAQSDKFEITAVANS